MSDPAAPELPPKPRKSHRARARGAVSPIDKVAPEPPPGIAIRKRVVARLKGLAAATLSADLAAGAGDPREAPNTVRLFLCHQLAAGHVLTMDLGARAGRLVRRADGGKEAGRNSQEALRFVAGTARLMERCRAGALALHRLGYPVDPNDDPNDPKNQRRHTSLALEMACEAERRRVLGWLREGKPAADMPGVGDWPPYYNPDPGIKMLQRPPARAPLHADPGAPRGRLKNGNPAGDYRKAPRCGAKTRAKGCCSQPAMANGKCRFHGGKSTGPRTAAGRKRAQAARLTHGFRTAEIIDLRSRAARAGRNLHLLARIAKETFTAKSQRPRSGRHLEKPAEREMDCAAEGCASKPIGTASPGPFDRSTGFVPFVTSRCNPSARDAIFAGHGVDRSESPRAPSPAGHAAPQRRRRAA
jgi:hypothetical protein